MQEVSSTAICLPTGVFAELVMNDGDGNTAGRFVAAGQSATLMLAAGENPEWVARMLGHSTTEMLFRTYSRFIPNLTRDDGRAFAGLLKDRCDASTTARLEVTRAEIEGLAPDQLRELLLQRLPAAADDVKEPRRD